MVRQYRGVVNTKRMYHTPVCPPSVNVASFPGSSPCARRRKIHSTDGQTVHGSGNYKVYVTLAVLPMYSIVTGIPHLCFLLCHSSTLMTESQWYWILPLLPILILEYRSHALGTSHLYRRIFAVRHRFNSRPRNSAIFDRTEWKTAIIRIEAHFLFEECHHYYIRY